MTRRPSKSSSNSTTRPPPTSPSALASSAHQLAEVRDWTFGGDTYRFNVSAAIIHVTNHGMHHRAQCMNMLRHLGKPVNADLDELEWQVAGEP
jgi:uncharacterized damage-inducible protein DinB